MHSAARSIRLLDRRVLAYDEYGEPKGFPVLYFHGWPASRLSARIYHERCLRLGIRMISIDRPGYGYSDYQTGRTITDWAIDIRQFIDLLQIPTCSVLGVSGGGPYAAVCAYAMPNRIKRAGIAVGLGPFVSDDITEGMLWIGRTGWQLFKRHEWARSASCYGQMIAAYYFSRAKLHTLSWGKTDVAILRDTAISERLYETVREAFRQGIRGPKHDLKLYTNDWGFPLSDVHCPVYLWYGAKDRNVSVNMGYYYKKVLPDSRLKVYKNEGHLLSVTRAHEILHALLP